jgi:hypothetical protein
MCILEGNDMVPDLHIGDALPYGLDDTGSLVSENNGECTLWIFA